MIPGRSNLLANLRIMDFFLATVTACAAFVSIVGSAATVSAAAGPVIQTEDVERFYRVYEAANGQPTEIEMYVQLRKFDGTADSAKSVRFAWPA